MRDIAGFERRIHELQAVNYSVGELGRFNPAFCARGARVGRWIDDIPRIRDQFPSWKRIADHNAEVDALIIRMRSVKKGEGSLFVNSKY